jgi:hypothetical protein
MKAKKIIECFVPVFFIFSMSLSAPAQTMPQSLQNDKNFNFLPAAQADFYNQLFLPLFYYTGYYMYGASYTEGLPLFPMTGFYQFFYIETYEGNILNAAVSETGEYRYSYITLTRLDSKRFLQTIVVGLESLNNLSVTVFSNLVLTNISLKSESIFFNFKGSISPALSYNLNIDLNTNILYTNPLSILKSNDESIAKSRFSINYRFE